jgi:DNA-binding transcriptional LysR family regulator
MVADLDLNLLKVFDALIEAGSVTGAADRLHLSVPATSRALGRLRRAMGDPVFVRAGRGLAPTPFALRAAPQVRSVLDSAQALMINERDLDLAQLDRTFTIRINDSLAATLAAGLITEVTTEAPRVTVRLIAEGAEDIEALRGGAIDLDVGIHEHTAPDLRNEGLYSDRFVALVARDSPLGRRRRISLPQLCAYPHISTSRRGRARGPLDDALAPLGLQRHVAAVVTSYPVAVMMAAESDLVALVPSRLAVYYTGRLNVRWFGVPLELPEFTVSQQWHSRLDHDPAQQWLRGQVRRAATDRADGPLDNTSI